MNMGDDSLGILKVSVGASKHPGVRGQDARCARPNQYLGFCRDCMLNDP